MPRSKFILQHFVHRRQIILITGVSCLAAEFEIVNWREKFLLVALLELCICKSSDPKVL